MKDHDKSGQIILLSDLDKAPLSEPLRSRLEIKQAAHAAVVVLKDYYKDRNELLGAIEELANLFEGIGVPTSLEQFAKVVQANGKMELALLTHLFDELSGEANDGN